MRRARFFLALAVAFLAAGSVNSECQSAYDDDAVNTGGHTIDAVANNPRWMTPLPDSLKLSELSLPGTHDTCALWGMAWGRAQAMTVSSQLHSGIRFMDLRCVHSSDRCDLQ